MSRTNVFNIFNWHFAESLHGKPKDTEGLLHMELTEIFITKVLLTLRHYIFYSPN